MESSGSLGPPTEGAGGGAWLVPLAPQTRASAQGHGGLSTIATGNVRFVDLHYLCRANSRAANKTESSSGHGRKMETERRLSNEIIMPPRQAEGVSHGIMYVAHQALSRCLMQNNTVIHADSSFCLELAQEILESTLPRSASLHVCPGPCTSWSLTSLVNSL